MHARSQYATLAPVFIALFINIALWFWSKDIYAKWDGVPPPPGKAGALAASLGDASLAYRAFGLMLQNLGDVGRDVTPLKGYNYVLLHDWFMLLHQLDPISDHMPMVAAYYFGGTRVPKDVREVIDYLAVAGEVRVGEKWRWLAHAAYLAQHRLGDTDMALDFAYKLTRMNQEGIEMPQWARQMPAFVLVSKGDNDAARSLMTNMLVTDTTQHPEEVEFMKSFLIERLGMDPKEVEALVQMRGEGAAPEQ